MLALCGWTFAVAATGFSEAELATAVELRERALKDQTAWQVVEGLTTEIGPRLAGSANDQRARDWMTARFKALGFHRVYSEPVEFPVWERGFESLMVMSPFPQRLQLTALGGSRGTGRGGLKAEVVEFPSLAALDAAEPAAVRGKIVFINQRMQRQRDGSGYSEISRIRGTGASAAARKGARGFLLRSAGTDDKSRAPHTGMMRYENTPTRIPAAALSNVDADLLEQILRRGTPVTLKLEIATRSKARRYRGANVIAEIRGRQWPDEVVVIGGHLDSWDLGTGAIDDGAGVAITTAAAALIGQLPQPPRRTVRVIAFANEEQGLYGGKAYAAARAGELAQQAIAAESDFGAGRVYRLQTRVGTAALPAIAQMFEVLAPLGITAGDNAATGGPDVSDLGKAGVPLASLNQDGTHYFDWHHTENDTLDKIDPADLQQNVAAWVVFSYLAAEYPGSFR